MHDQRGDLSSNVDERADTWSLGAFLAVVAAMFGVETHLTLRRDGDLGAYAYDTQLLPHIDDRERKLSGCCQLAETGSQSRARPARSNATTGPPVMQRWREHPCAAACRCAGGRFQRPASPTTAQSQPSPSKGRAPAPVARPG
jgi:hypothetical protein